MAAYSTAQVDELLADEVAEIRSSPMRWRRLGLVAAALGTAGALVGIAMPRAPTPMEEMHQVVVKTHSFMQAVLERALAADGEASDDLMTEIGLTVAEKGTTPDKMKVAAHWRPASEEHDAMQAIFSFKAKTEKGNALKKQLEKVIEAGKNAKDTDIPPPVLDSFNQMTVSVDGDDVHIHLVPTKKELENTPTWDDKVNQDMLDAKASLKFEIGTGHDFGQMANNAAGCPYTLLGGFRASMTTKVARAMIEEALANPPVPIPEEDRVVLKVLSAMDSFDEHTTANYHKSKFEKALCQVEPEQAKQQMKMIKRMAPHLARKHFGEDMVEALTGLAEYSDSFRSIRFVGMMPANYEIAFEFENLKLAPVFKEFFSMPPSAET